MYSYLIGTVTDQQSTYISLEVNNIGYLINVSNPYSYKVNNTYKVYIYQHIREDENTLYGFNSIDEKQLFLKLISVKGIGPKMAMPLFATGTLESLSSSIEKGDINYLKKFPKIGEKVAKQIILDLKGKLDIDESKVTVNHELKEVLIGLGYKEKDFRSVLKNIDATLPIENQVKEALKLLLK